jgi:hypothetical protein
MTESDMSWPDFTCLVEAELQMAGLPFDLAELIYFIEANHGLIDDAPDPALWAERFAAFVRERMAMVLA